jgi:uncharacterized repeat protein (TIGR03803 family)
MKEYRPMNSLTNSEIPVSIQARPEKTTSRKLNLIISNPRSSKRMRNWWMRTSAVVLLCAAAAVISPAQTFSVLHRFLYTDGANPLGTLVQGANGTFYGTTINGGTNQVGTVFKITASGTLTTLHNFDGADGQAAFAGLVQATNGNFYGTTYFGGTGGACEVGSCGTVFTMTPGGTLTTLHSFDGTDGGNPFAGLVQATNGNFYGATYAGGASAACTDGCGTIFTITPAGTLTTLYSFCSESDCTDGQQPYGRLVQGTDGNLYGTASAGGAGGGGTVFKITLGGTLTTLYSFCSESDCTDGQQPFAGLVQASNGSFYGATTEGGIDNDGTVFQINSGGTLTTLHSFDGTDGDFPAASLIQATDSNLYGTTQAGGAGCSSGSGCGTAFKITPGGTLTTLKIFNPTVGTFLYAGLLQATNGMFYGTAGYNGNTGDGTVFSLSEGLSPFVETLPTSGTVGATVKVLGTNLTGATGVTFNGTPATFTVVSASLITTTVPAGATTGRVRVTTPSGTLVSNVVFRVAP